VRYRTKIGMPQITNLAELGQTAALTLLPIVSIDWDT
jgi:hypothetical protein